MRKLYAKIIDNEIVKWPLSGPAISSLHPNVMFPMDFESDNCENLIINELGYTRVYPNEEVKHTTSEISKSYEFKFGDPTLAQDGKWYYAIEKIEIEVGSERYKDRLSYQWGIIRTKRNKLLKETDSRIFRHLREVSLGLELSDNIIELETYRQDLCDITNQDDPFKIVWPAEGW